MRSFYTYLGAIVLVFTSITVSSGAEFFRRQAGTTTLTGSNTTVTITTVDMSKSFLVFSSTLSDTEPDNYQVGGEISDANTITFRRSGTTGTMSISWQIFEFESGVFVQRGSTSVPLSTNVDIGISCVDLNKSFVILSGRNDGTTLGNDDGITGNLTSATNLRLLTGTSGGNFDEAFWQVIEYQGAVVQKVTASLTGTSVVSAIPTPVDVNKTLIISTHLIGGNSVAEDLPRTELTATNQITYTRVGSGNTMTFLTYVVEFTDQTIVSRGNRAFGSGVVTQSFAVTSTSASGVFGSGNYGKQGSTNHSADDNTGHVWFTYNIVTPGTLQIDRAIGTGSTANAPWQIVTFEDTNNGLQTSTFYSISSGDWESSATWSYTQDGSSGAVPTGVYPRRTNNVVIQSGHTIAVNSVTDNNPCSQSPNGLGLGNVGTFTGSGDQMFYHTGDILIANGGTLTSSEEVMIEGYTLIENGGTFSITEDIINLGYFEIASGAIFTNTDDLILTGNSTTIIDNLSFGADDIYIDHTNATLCGEGVMNLGNGSPDPTIQFFNGGSLNQVCSTFSVTCTSNCGAFPITPTGNFSSGNSGPGGVGSVTSSGDIRLWLDANSINQTTGTNVTGWTDQSGYGNNAVAPVGNEPVFNTNQLNGFPAIQFSMAASDYLQVADDASLDLDVISMFVVGNLETTSTAYASFISKIQSGNVGFNGYALLRNNNLQGVSFAIDALGNEAQSAITYGVNAIHSSIYSDPGLEHFINEVGPSTDTYAGPITSHNTPLYIGGTVNATGSTPDRFLEGDISEVILTSVVLSDAKRIIIDNYLSSKFALSIANDAYSMDTPGNGNYDFNLAGIGQAADGSNHRDARGTGVVRMWNPKGLANSEFLMWGHDNTALNSSTTAVGTAVDGTIIQERLSRIWRVSETGDVGTVSISFDFSGVGGSPLGSNLRLLIDRDGDGFADNDVTPIAGSVSNGIAVFSNVNFQNGDRFTLGNTDASSPLPIELVMFKASPLRDAIKLNWTTASELNNDYFNIERSTDAEQWMSIATIGGAGTTIKTSTYEALDYQPLEGVSYYRLRQTDFDGKNSFSHIERVNFTGQNAIQVSPNPSDGMFYLANSAQLDVKSIRVLNNLGQVVFPVIRKDGNITIDLSHLSQGFYILQVWNGTFLNSVRLVKRN